MNTPKKTDVIDKIKEFQLELVEKKPDLKQMVHEVRMMNFKIRPIYGNITNLDFGNTEFIDALWSIGKLDEFFRRETPRVPESEKPIFFRIVNDLRIELQQRLKSANIDGINIAKQEPVSIFELEIIKDSSSRVN